MALYDYEKRNRGWWLGWLVVVGGVCLQTHEGGLCIQQRRSSHPSGNYSVGKGRHSVFGGDGLMLQITVIHLRTT